MNGYPLDLQTVSYSYLERPNRGILSLLERTGALSASNKGKPATILDVGCGCGANARAILERHPSTTILGIEPDPKAAELASQICERVFPMSVETWLSSGEEIPAIDVVLLSDVLEHVPDPVAWLRTIAASPALRDAVWIISVPNYGVWYNRLRTLFGRFEYQWSGLYDRTHLRFYTRRSIRGLLAYCGFRIEADRCTASIVQSAAPLLRRSFQSEVSAGNHLALLESRAFRFYRRFVEPAEEAFCNLWKGLLGFQIVTVAVRRSR
jgi:2-polyprenyl-3-methyl-5-hydroxy-6-metoxy-1,4-benzoquinol methylase